MPATKEFDRDSPASWGQKCTPLESAPSGVKQQPTSEEDASSNSDLPHEGSALSVSSHTAEPAKQNRPCAVCKLNHVACDRARPCTRCRRAGKEKECIGA